MHRRHVTKLLTILLVLPLWAESEISSSPDLLSLQPLVQGKGVPLTGQDSEPLLLQFWASWCHSCSGIMFDMDELMTANPGFRYVAVSLDEKALDAERYIRKHALFQKYADRYFYDAGKTLSRALGVKTVPTIMLLNRNGEVVVKKSGHLNSTDKQELASQMKNAL